MKSGLQDNYEAPFDVIARSDKYFTIRFDNGWLDNVMIDIVKPCFTQTKALPQPAPSHQCTRDGVNLALFMAYSFSYKSSYL